MDNILDDDPPVPQDELDPTDITFTSKFAIVQGELFLDGNDFNDRIMDWSVDAHFGYKIQVSRKMRIVVGCRAANQTDASLCPFHITATRRSVVDMFVVGGDKFNPHHTCSKDTTLFRHAINRQRWLCRRVHEAIVIDSKTSPTEIHTALRNR